MREDWVDPDSPSPAALWDREVVRRSLDELYELARRYRSSSEYMELMRFVVRFRFYSPFNALLVQIQMPGATYAAPAHRWRRDYGRRIKAGGRPLVILQPMGPVMFVFDVSDTEPEDEAPPLPRDVTHPFETRAGRVGSELDRVVENAKRDGVHVIPRDAGSQSAGAIRTVKDGRYLKVVAKHGPPVELVQVPLRYELFLNSDHSREATYATAAHELAHLYCGHVGTPNPSWWPDRRGLSDDLREFEAESVCFLLCGRLGIDNPSEEYLSQYAAKFKESPAISLESVMKAAGLIERMGREHLKPRKDKEP